MLTYSLGLQRPRLGGATAIYGQWRSPHCRLPCCKTQVFFFTTHFICPSGIPNQNAFNSYMILLYLTTQAYFVLWSVQHNELLWRVMCGGAHRVWDLVLQQSVHT